MNISHRMANFERKLEAWSIVVQSLGTRRLDLAIETSVPLIQHGSYILRNVASENGVNDIRTRREATLIFERVTESLISKRVLYDARPICDETNNPPNVIDENGLQLDLFLRTVGMPTAFMLPLTTMTQASADALYNDWSSTPPEKRGNEYKDRTRVQIIRG